MKKKETPRSVFVRTAIILGLFCPVIFVGCVQNTSKNPAGTNTSELALQRLLIGNKRFLSLHPIHPHETIEQIKNVAKEQHPFAVIVSCSDSRVSPELIFDEGIGDLFVIRTAGNIIGGLEVGSVEYAVEHLGVKLIVVMGHENCGVVKAFIEGGETHGHLKDIIDSIKLEAEIQAIPIDDANRQDDCVVANVQHGVRQLLLQSVLVHEKVEKKHLKIVGMRYDLDDLSVKIISQ